MPDEGSTIEQLIDEALPVLQAARDFPARDMTYEERGYTGNVLNYMLRWDNPEWRQRRGLLFEPLPDDPPLILAVKATVLAINIKLQPPRRRGPDEVRRSAALAMAAITVYRNPVPVVPPEPQVGMFPASINPLVAIETGPEREPDSEARFEHYIATREFHLNVESHSVQVQERDHIWFNGAQVRLRNRNENDDYDFLEYEHGHRFAGAIHAGWAVLASTIQAEDEPPSVPEFEPYISRRNFRMGTSEAGIEVRAGDVIWFNGERVQYNGTVYNTNSLRGAIRVGWVVRVQGQPWERWENPAADIVRQARARAGLSDEAYERFLHLLSMPEMSHAGTRDELRRLLETPVGQEPQRRVPFILSHESTDRLVGLITSGIRPVPGEDMMEFIERPIPGQPPPQPVSENEVLSLMFDTPIPVPPSLQREREQNTWRSPLAQAIEDDREVLRRLGSGRGTEEDERHGDRIRQDVLSGRHTITREEALEYMFPISRDFPAPALVSQLSSPWREWAIGAQQRPGSPAEEQDGIRGPRAMARERHPFGVVPYMKKEDDKTSWQHILEDSLEDT